MIKKNSIVSYLINLEDCEISDAITFLISEAHRVNSLPYDEDLITGGIEAVEVSTEEDMLIATCSIAESIVFGREVVKADINIE